MTMIASSQNNTIPSAVTSAVVFINSSSQLMCNSGLTYNGVSVLTLNGGANNSIQTVESIISGVTSSAVITTTGTSSEFLIKTTSTASGEESRFILDRGDSTNGYAQFHLKTAGVEDWVFGTRASSSALTFIYDGTLTAFSILSSGNLLQMGGGGAGPATGLLTLSSTSSATATSYYGLSIAKQGTDLLFLGISGSLPAGQVPGNALYLSSFGTNSVICIGRGAGNALNNADIKIDGNGNILLQNGYLTVGTTSNTSSYQALIQASSSNLLSVSTTSTAVNSTLSNAISFLAPGLTGASILEMTLGIVNSVNNLATIRFFSSSTSSSLNALFLGLRGAESLLAIYNNQINSNTNFCVSTIGSGFRTAEGSNAKQNAVTLVGGTLVVSNTSITANSRIFVFCQTSAGTPGYLRVSAKVPGTSFTILSSSNLDTSLVAYVIFEPA